MIITRQAEQNRLAGLGITGDALEQLLAEGASARHKARVEAAVSAAREWAAGVGGGDAAAMLVCLADRGGPGGPWGILGGSTGRHPAFVGCGSGRKQARDGGAWSSAIAEAALVLRAGFAAAWWQVAVEAYSVADGVAIGIFVRDADGEILESADVALLGRDWYLSLVAEGLRISAEHGGLLEIPVRWDGEASVWAAAYNAACAEVAESLISP